MGRRYKVTFEGVAVTAAQDLVTVIGASGKIVRVLRCWVANTDTTLATAQMLQLRQRLFTTATITAGSGGTTPTPTKIDPGDAAASFTAHVNDTTKTSTTGTVTIVDEDGCHIYAGYDKVALSPVPVGPSEYYVFELLSTVSGTVHLSGGVEVEELGG
jgi:hypothetical protein